MTALVDPDMIPRIDTECVRAASGELRAMASTVSGTTDAITASWSGLSEPGVYEAPEGPTVYGLMGPASAAADEVTGSYEAAAQALDDFATALDGITKDLEDVRSDVAQFHADALGFSSDHTVINSVGLGTASTTVVDKPSTWEDDPGLCDRNNVLLARINDVVARIVNAEGECANKIRDLITDTDLPVSPTDVTGEQLDATTGLPWGERIDHEPKNCGESALRGVNDSLMSMVEGGLSLFTYNPRTGEFFDWGNAGQSWLGLAESCLASALAPVMLPEYVALNMPGLRDSLGDSNVGTRAIKRLGQTYFNTSAGLVDIDPTKEDPLVKWHEDPVRAGFTTGTNILPFLIPGGEAGDALKGATEGAGVGGKIARGGMRAAESIADLVLPGGSGLLRLGERLVLDTPDFARGPGLGGGFSEEVSRASDGLKNADPGGGLSGNTSHDVEWQAGDGQPMPDFGSRFGDGAGLDQMGPGNGFGTPEHVSGGGTNGGSGPENTRVGTPGPGEEPDLSGESGSSSRPGVGDPDPLRKWRDDEDSTRPRESASGEGERLPEWRPDEEPEPRARRGMVDPGTREASERESADRSSEHRYPEDRAPEDGSSGERPYGDGEELDRPGRRSHNDHDTDGRGETGSRGDGEHQSERPDRESDSRPRRRMEDPDTRESPERETARRSRGDGDDPGSREGADRSRGDRSRGGDEDPGSRERPEREGDDRSPEDRSPRERSHGDGEESDRHGWSSGGDHGTDGHGADGHGGREHAGDSSDGLGDGADHEDASGGSHHGSGSGQEFFLDEDGRRISSRFDSPEAKIHYPEGYERLQLSQDNPDGVIVRRQLEGGGVAEWELNADGEPVRAKARIYSEGDWVSERSDPGSERARIDRHQRADFNQDRRDLAAEEAASGGDPAAIHRDRNTWTTSSGERLTQADFDAAGHLIPFRFLDPADGGSFNFMSQNGGFNSGRFRQWEDEIASAVKDHEYVDVDITVNRPASPAHARPETVEVEWNLPGASKEEADSMRFKNERYEG